MQNSDDIAFWVATMIGDAWDVLKKQQLGKLMKSLHIHYTVWHSSSIFLPGHTDHVHAGRVEGKRSMYQVTHVDYRYIIQAHLCVVISSLVVPPPTFLE
jgi:hypothetical protein